MEQNNFTSMRTGSDKRPLMTLTPYKEDDACESERCNTYVIVSDNSLFNNGICGVVNGINKKISGLFYFIDFNSDFFKYYLQSSWMNDYPTGSKIIIFTDRRMRALANYWFYHHLPHVTICAVIYDNIRIIHDVFSGNVIFPQKAASKLSDYEYIILRKICEGICIKKIAHLINKSPKTVYTFKNRIEAKLHSKIKRLL